MRRKIGQPRFIDVSLVEIGDEIIVEHVKEAAGIKMTLQGVVAQVVDGGAVRFLKTAENGTLATYDARTTNAVRVTLLAREEPEGSTMFDIEPNQYTENLDAVKARLD